MGGGNAVYSVCVDHTISHMESPSWYYLFLMLSMSGRIPISYREHVSKSHSFQCSTSAIRHPPDPPTPFRLPQTSLLPYSFVTLLRSALLDIMSWWPSLEVLPHCPHGDLGLSLWCIVGLGPVETIRAYLLLHSHLPLRHSRQIP